MATDSKKTCKHCKFWTGDRDRDYGTGDCRREPPKFITLSGGSLSGYFGKNPHKYSGDSSDQDYQIQLNSEQGYSSNQGNWPITEQGEWCGEFKKVAEDGIEKALERMEEKESI